MLFSIVGSGAAVYIAAITGAGYRRETGVLLGILTAVVVGIAEGFLLWILVGRVEESRKYSVKMWTGSASEGPKQPSGALTDGTELSSDAAVAAQADLGGSGAADAPAAENAVSSSTKPQIRLRRRALHAT